MHVQKCYEKENRKKYNEKISRTRLHNPLSFMQQKKKLKTAETASIMARVGLIKMTLKIEPHIDGIHNNLCALSASNFMIMWDSERWWERKWSLMAAEGRMKIPSSPFKKWVKKKKIYNGRASSTFLD